MPKSEAFDRFADKLKRTSSLWGDKAESAVKAAPDLAAQARKAVEDGVDQLRRADLGEFNDRLDDARGYVVDRVQKKPVAATVVALALGFLIGLMFAGKRR